MLKELPISITKRISNISSGEEIYDNATPIYQTALTSTSYNMILIYTKTPNKGIEEKKSKKNLWLNQPYSSNVKANVVKMFLND